MSGVLGVRWRDYIHPPTTEDDKYSRGVVGFITSSNEFPGAALLGITAAMRSGVGMVRYLGPQRVADLVLLSRPETVLQDGRAQAWVVGSGVPVDDAEQGARIRKVVSESNLVVVDAGALQIIDFAACKATCVLTPHAGEAATLLSLLGEKVSRAEVEADPTKYALLIAMRTKQLTVLKGNQTVVALITADGTERSYRFDSAPAVLATAGSGDVLAGIIGGLLAGNAAGIHAGTTDLFEVVKAAIAIQAQAGALAAESSSVLALDIAEAVGRIVTAE